MDPTSAMLEKGLNLASQAIEADDKGNSSAIDLYLASALCLENVASCIIIPKGKQDDSDPNSEYSKAKKKKELLLEKASEYKTRANQIKSTKKKSSGSTTTIGFKSTTAASTATTAHSSSSYTVSSTGGTDSTYEQLQKRMEALRESSGTTKAQSEDQLRSRLDKLLGKQDGASGATTDGSYAPIEGHLADIEAENYLFNALEGNDSADDANDLATLMKTTLASLKDEDNGKGKGIEDIEGDSNLEVKELIAEAFELAKLEKKNGSITTTAASGISTNAGDEQEKSADKEVDKEDNSEDDDSDDESDDDDGKKREKKGKKKR